MRSRNSNALFSGDHVMAWSTSIVAPPDGAMSDYMASLEKLKSRPETTYFPGHGTAIKDAPLIRAQLYPPPAGARAIDPASAGKGEADIPTLVRAIYIGIDPRLMGAAGLSVLAHLEDLVARQVVATEGPPSIKGHYRLAAG